MRFWLRPSEPRSWLNLVDVGRDTPQGAELHVRVTPRAGKNAVTGERAGMLLLSVRAAPTDGEANAAVIQTLAEILGISRGRLFIVRGEKSREKWVRVDGASLETVYTTLEKHLMATGRC